MAIELNLNVKMTTNPCYSVTKEEHEYEYVLPIPDSVNHNIQDMYRKGQGYTILANDATETRGSVVIQQNSSCSSDLKEVTSEMSRKDEDTDDYLQINSQGAGYKITGRDVATGDIDNVTIIPNPSYEVVSGGVRLQDNPSYSKI